MQIKKQINCKMTEHIPKVSLGLPVYNGEKYLRSALESILQQDYGDFELIISDNASTDATQEICEEFASRDHRIRYYRNETNIGASKNYNRVFNLSRGEFFKWASHDDEFHTSFVRRCLETFEASTPETVLVFSKAEIIDEAGQVKHLSQDIIDSSSARPSKRLVTLVFYRCYAHPLWGLIRSDALRRTRLMGCFEADHIVLFELALLGKLVEIPEVLYRLRMHPGNAMELNRTPRQLLIWYDPSSAGRKIILPHWLWFDLECYRAIRHVPLTGIERLLCYCVLRPTLLWRWMLSWSTPLRYRIGLRRRRPHPVVKSGAIVRTDV
jgi:glycosyltransferase involved in cell wall biosynthesis